MFRLYFDESRSDCWTEVEKRLAPLAAEVNSYYNNLSIVLLYSFPVYLLAPIATNQFPFQVIQYFLSLNSETHSEAWTSVLLLLFTQLARYQ